MAADFVIPVFLSLSKMPFLTDIECKDKDALRKVRIVCCTHHAYVEPKYFSIDSYTYNIKQH